MNEKTAINWKDIAARAAYEANRAYCEQLGDRPQATWGLAPVWQRDSASKGVEAIYADPGISPRESHEGWMRLKTEEGWTYGEKKDPKAKTHPCLVSYTDLPREQRLKDGLFGKVVRGVLNMDDGWRGRRDHESK